MKNMSARGWRRWQRLACACIRFSESPMACSKTTGRLTRKSTGETVKNRQPIENNEKTRPVVIRIMIPKHPYRDGRKQKEWNRDSPKATTALQCGILAPVPFPTYRYHRTGAGYRFYRIFKEL